MAGDVGNPIPFTLTIDGMTCGHCVRAVTRALSEVPGVTVGSVGVGVADLSAADRSGVDRAVGALDEAGYTARAELRTPADAGGRGRPRRARRGPGRAGVRDCFERARGTAS